MTRIYMLNADSPADEPQIFTWAGHLSESRQNKIRQLRFREDKLLSLGAGLLLDMGLREYGLSEREAALEYRHNGKPYLRDFPELFFNLSHSGTMVMAAFSDREIGCDVERIKEAKMGVAKRFFTEEELALLSEESLTPQERDVLFTRVWTLKESVLKVTGEGMRLPLSDFAIHLTDPVSVIWKKNMPELSFREYEVPGYRAAVCAQGGPEVFTDVFFSFQNLQDVVR